MALFTFLFSGLAIRDHQAPRAAHPGQQRGIGRKRKSKRISKIIGGPSVLHEGLMSRRLKLAGICLSALASRKHAVQEGVMPPAANQPKPTRRPDLALQRKYGGLIAGVDEAGRGPWAGPVVAAAVIFTGKPPAGINDSKRLTAEVRKALFPKIQAAACIGVGIIGVEAIDELNIYHATHAAMAAAIANLACAPSAVLVDGNRYPKLDMPAEALVGGDALSISIAAASIIAKVTRDRIMLELATGFPLYAWERNKGYGTREHAAALNQHGVCCHHRKSFRPVWERAMLDAEAD